MPLKFLLPFACALLLSPAERFTAEEKQLISAQSATTAMRVWVISNPSDSAFLRQPCRDISPKANKKLLALFIKRLYATVTDSAHLGVGIAAPQVGIGRNIILVQRFDKKEFPFEAYINPTIEEYSAQKQPCKEGCLSIPGRSATTQDRAETIRIRYQTPKGEWREESVSGFTAVVFQHEIDHLRGILYIDHLLAEKK